MKPFLLALRRSLFDALDQHHLTPMVTLLHFVVPGWIADEGGLESDGIVEAYADFVKVVAQRYRGRHAWWVPLNEASVFLNFERRHGACRDEQGRAREGPARGDAREGVRAAARARPGSARRQQRRLGAVPRERLRRLALRAHSSPARFPRRRLLLLARLRPLGRTRGTGQLMEGGVRARRRC